MSIPGYAAIALLDELGSAGVIGVEQVGLTPPASVHAVIEGGGFRPFLAKAVTTGVGDDLFDLMRLDRIAASEIEELLAELSRNVDD